MSIFFDRFSALCEEADTYPNVVAKINGISSGSVTAWKKGTIPRPETLSKLAEHFCVSVDYLVGNSDKRNISLEDFLKSEDEKRNSAGISKKEWDLIMRYRNATDREKSVVDALFGLEQE